MPPPTQLTRSIPKWPSPNALLKRRKKDNFQPFEATELILSLDAENSPYVRPFSKKKDGEPLPPGRHRERELRPARKFAAGLNRLSQEYQLQSTDTVSKQFDIWRITNYDILSVALRNEPMTRQSHDDYHVVDENNIYDQNGIPRHILDNPSKIIAHMLHRQKISHRLEPTQDDLTQFRKTVKKCRDLDQIERVIIDAIGTPSGRWLIANSTNAIGRACVDMAGEMPPGHMLTFLNNLIILLEPEKLEIPPLFLYGAILASIQCGVFDVAQRYLRMAKDSGVDFNVWLVVGVLNVLETSSLKELITPSAIQKYPTYPLLAIYSLLTGQVSGEKIPQPSILDFIPTSTTQGAYQGPYVACLACLGAFRTMWHFWHMHPVPPEDKDTSNAEIFAQAIHKAMLANHHLMKLAQVPNFTRVVGSYPDDCQLDIETIIESIKILSSPKPTSDVQCSPPSRKAIGEIFGETSIEKSMLALQRYLYELSSTIPLGEDID